MPKPLFGDNGSRHAHPHFALERWQTALCRERLRRAERYGAVFHRRNLETRAGAHLHHQPDHQQLQTARPRIRSAGQSRLLRAQSLRRDSHSDLLSQSEIEAHRVPHARCRRESISRLLRAAARRSRWNPKPHRSRRSARQKPLRTAAGRTRASRRACPIHSAARSKRSKPITPSCCSGDVFNADFIANWIEMKQKEYDALRLRPHPYEFAMYYDV